MRTIGVTGGIATGKSLVTSLLRRHGALVFSADEAARAVCARGSLVVQRIGSRFGLDAVLPSGIPDRARLAHIVFADPAARRELESITHPAILHLLCDQISAARVDLTGVRVLAVEMPLLYEAHAETMFDSVWVVASSEERQLERLTARDGLSPADARARIASQMPLTEKMGRADCVVWNESTPDEVDARVSFALRSLGLSV